MCTIYLLVVMGNFNKGTRVTVGSPQKVYIILAFDHEERQQIGKYPGLLHLRSAIKT